MYFLSSLKGRGSFFIFGLIVYVASTISVSAANTHTVSPLALNLDLEKRDIINDVITLTNTSDRRIRVYATVNTVATNGEGVVESFASPVEVDRTNTPTSWIEISRKRTELAPGEKLEVPFTIRMNPQVQPGDYSVYIGFAEGSNRAASVTKVRNGEAPGTIVNISVDKKQNQFLRLERFIIEKFITKDFTNVISISLMNPSAVDVIPKGEIIFYNNSGTEVASAPVNTNDTPVVAGETTVLMMNAPSELPMGKYKAFLSVEFGEFLTNSVQDTTYFYVVPLFQLILIFLTILFLTILLALFVYRKYDTDEVTDGSQPVAMYMKEGKTPEQHHDVDLSKKDSI